jgi:hypothetical protein
MWLQQALQRACERRFLAGRSQATARAGGIANPLLRAISSDLDSFIGQHLSYEDRVAVPIHPKSGKTAMAQPVSASAKPGAEAKVKDAIGSQTLHAA